MSKTVTYGNDQVLSRYWEKLTSRAYSASLFSIMIFLIVVPISVLVIGSFLSEPPRALKFNWSSFTLSNYESVFFDSRFTGVIGVTLGMAAVGTIGAVIIGCLLAWLTARTNVPAAALIGIIAISPMFMPPLVAAFAWEILGSPRSGMINVIGRGLGFSETINIYSYGGIAFVFSVYYAPYIYLFVNATLKNIDSSLEEASSISGASPLRTLFRVTIPLIVPSILSAALLVFVLLIELFAIPAVLAEARGIRFMSVYIWQLATVTPPQIGHASAHGVTLLLITSIIVFVQQRFVSKRSYVVVGGKGKRSEQHDLGRYRYGILAICILYGLIAVVLPYISIIFIATRDNLFFSNFSQMVNPSAFSLDAISKVFRDNVVMLSLKNSLTASVGTMIVGSALYFLVAHAIHRLKVRGHRLLELISILPIAVPGMVLSLGYMWTWISLPVGIYGTIWILVLAYVSQFSPQGTGAVAGSLRQIHPELEESSRLSGGGFFYTLRRVTLPLCWPGLVSAMILILVLSFRELATALFLFTSSTQVLSVTMFDYWISGHVQSVAVMALLQAAVLLAILGFGRLLQKLTTTRSSPG